MAFDEGVLREAYDLTTIHVRSSTHISSRTSSVISRLSETEHATPPLLALTAEAKATGKLISIVEIAKRELVAKNIKIYQYNQLSSKLVEIDRQPKSRRSRTADTSDGESEDAFEAVDAAAELPPTKRRNMPVMTVYLTITPARELRAAFGEQT